MEEVNGAIEALLNFDVGVDQMSSGGGWFELIDGPVVADGVVVGDRASGFAAEDGLQVDPWIEGSPGGDRLGGRLGESAAVAWDELAVEIACGVAAVVDAVSNQLGDESVLEAAVEPFSASSCLRAVGEGQSHGEGLHGDLEGGGRDGASLLAGSVIGADELAGAVQIEADGQSESPEEAVADLKTAVAILLELERAAEGLSGGVVTGQQEADRRMILAEPWMGTAVEEEQFALAFSPLASSPVDLESPGFASMAEGPEEASEGLVGDVDVLLVGEGVGEVGEVVAGVGGLRQVDDAFPPTVGQSVVGCSAGVAVSDAGGSAGFDLSFEPLDLPDREAEGVGGLLVGHSVFDGGLDDLVPSCLGHGQRFLLVVQGGSP